MKGPSVVIIGSGPGGFYAAESISKKLNSDIVMVLDECLKITNDKNIIKNSHNCKMT